MIAPIRIGKRRVGPGRPVYIIAEMSANHHQDYGTAEQILHAAKESGADAVKLQTFTPDLHTLDVDDDRFCVRGGTLWDGRRLYDLYQEAYMPWEWQPRLKEVALEIGIDLFSAAIDPTGISFLDEMGVPALKIPSFEIVDIALIEAAARTGKPLIISTGMATLGEIEEAVATARGAGARQIALLKCTSAYPAPPEEMNLLTIPHLSQAFGVPVGISDHTLGNVAPVVAVSLGACMVEKHFTLSRKEPGPDSSFSLEPQEFASMAACVREAEKVLGQVKYQVTRHEQANRRYRRSLFVTQDIRKGDPFTSENVRSLRPGDGLHPRYLSQIIGRRARTGLKKGVPLRWDLVD